MTRDEYTQKFGQPPPVQAATPVVPAKTSTYVSPGSPESQKPVQTAFGDAVNKRVDNVDAILKDKTPAGKTNLFEKGLGLFGQGVGAASDLATDTIGAAGHVANQALGGVPGMLADKAVQSVVKSPLGAQGVSALKQGVDAWTAFEQKYPRAAQDLSAIPAIANLVTTFYTGGAAAEAGTIAKQVGKKTLENITEKTAANTAAKTAVAGKDAALARVMPDYESATNSAKLKLQAETVKNDTNATVPRVNEGGLFKGRTLTPTKLEKQAAQELRTVPGYKDKLTNLETENLIRPEIAARGKALESSLSKENILVPRKQVVSIVRKAVEDVPKHSLLLQKSDPAIASYLRVTENAANANDGTLAGVLRVRKNLDAAYANARGKLAYDNDKLAALDDVHRAGRDALTQYLIDTAKTTKVKEALQSQWNLYRALDEISVKAAKESGSSYKRLRDTIEKHPVMSGAAGAAATLVGAKTLGF